jgi:large subunit ribosomal protein L3
MKVIIGQKVGMSQVFSAEGEVIPVTLIFAEPNIITLRRFVDKDGYAAAQLALPRQKEVKKDGERHNKKDLKGKPKELKRRFMARREFPIEIDEKESVVTVKQFEVGDTVAVVGTSKGKGFQGVVKRHGFKGGPASHGHRHSLRQAGSIGSAYPQHVFKGKRMAGRMGSDRVTVKNLSVVWIDEEKNVLAVKGAVPGSKGSVVEIISE